MSDRLLNIHEAKTHLSRHLAELSQTDRIVLCRRNRPIAEIRLLPPKNERPRMLGAARGDFVLGEGFFEPLPDDVLEAFEGGA